MQSAYILPSSCAGNGTFPFGSTLAVLSGFPSDSSVLEAAAAIVLAGVTWRAILPVSLPARAKCRWGESPEHALAVDYAVRREDAAIYLAMMRRTLARMAVNQPCEVGEALERDLAPMLLAMARRANLLVMATPGGRPADMPAGAHWFARLLMQSGRPVLVLPPSARLHAAPSRALVCYRATPQATRALHEAIHTLPGACSVHLVSVLGSSGSRADASNAASLAAAADHVRRHGRHATFEIVDSQGGPPEDAVLQKAREVAADVIVMGAYGHARYAELVFGGTTQALLWRSGTALFMAH